MEYLIVKITKKISAMIVLGKDEFVIGEKLQGEVGIYGEI